MVESIERPIFVIGAPRSGTTLLRFMLCSNPRIYIPSESNFIPRFFQHQPSAPVTRQKALQAVKYICNHRQFMRYWQGARPDPTAFVEGLPDLKPATILDTLYSQYARQHGAVRWGDKSPIYTGYVELIAEIFPAAQFIHIIRDGRDVALSTLEAYREDRLYVDIYYAARTWKLRVHKALASAAKLGPDRYCELRYEQLTTDPETLLKAICSFLGETYLPSMVEPHKLAHDMLSPRGAHAAVRQPLTTKSSGRWRNEMSQPDQRLFGAVAGDLLGELGYDTVNSDPLSSAERARLVGLQTKYTTLEAGRRILQAVGIFSPH